MKLDEYVLNNSNSASGSLIKYMYLMSELLKIMPYITQHKFQAV